MEVETGAFVKNVALIAHIEIIEMLLCKKEFSVLRLVKNNLEIGFSSHTCVYLSMVT